MKVGDLEIPDSAVEAVLKASGKRIVEDSDYIKKSEAANDLAKFRAVTGDGRSIEELQGILKAHEESQQKNKTQVELLMAEVNRQKEIIAARERDMLNQSLEIKRRDVKQYFNEAMEANKLKIIEPILAPIREEIVGLDENKLSPESLKQAVNDALKRADELQRGELMRLGLNGISQPEPSSGFGSGYSSFQAPSGKGAEIKDVGDMFDIMRTTSAGPLGVPLGSPKQK
jgi:hypothetical protein